MSRTIWIATPLVFMSGLCSLAYQVVWTRELRLVFGASTAASSAVIAIFIAGLGLGGLWFARRVERDARPLALYGRLELGITLSSALTPWLLDGVRALYIASGGSLHLGSAGSTCLRLALATLVLGPPTFLMGGTLPSVARAIETERDVTRRRVAVAYGVNTLGAVLGCLLASFVFLEALGNRPTLYLACAINAVVGLLALAASRHLNEAAPLVGDHSAPAAAPSSFAWLVFVSAALAGFAFFLMELVWYRMLGPLLGGSTFTFGLILAVALAGIGLGSALYAAIGLRWSATLFGFALTCALEALFLALPYALGDVVAVLALLARPGNANFGELALGWAAIACLVVFPAALLSGFQFPLLIALLGRGREHVGRDVGAAYAANTVGAVAGALAGGFGLLPALGALGAWRSVCWILAGWSVALSIVAMLRFGARWRVLWVLASLALVLRLLHAEGPTAAFRHAPIGAGRIAVQAVKTPADINGMLTQHRRGVLWEADGRESAVALSHFDGLAFIVNGRSDGHARHDAPTQVMSGLVGAALLPRAKRAMVIGLGTGSTAGWLGKLPEIERVDVAEIEPAILEVARRCAAVNEDVLANPKVAIFQGDARELLSVSRERYDLIFSEPSNPYRAGIASLYTREFYQAVRKRLAPGGLFVQWLQAYEIDVASIRSVYATLSAVFPSVETWNGHDPDLLLVASASEPAHDVEALRARLASEPFARAMRAAWQTEGLEGFFAHYRANPAFARGIAAEEHVLNTDDRSPIEFSLSRSLGSGAVSSGWVSKQSRVRGQNRPQLRGGTVDWQRVDFEREAFILLGGFQFPEDLGLSREYQQRLAVLMQWANSDLTSARETWRSVTVDPSELSVIERIALAEIMAQAGDPDAPSFIAALEHLEPTQAAAMRGVWLARTGRPTEASTAIIDALHRYRTDPWPLLRPMTRAMQVLQVGTLGGPSEAAKWLEALSKPFAARVDDDAREKTRLEIVRALGVRDPACLQVMADLEPIAPWSEPALELRLACYEAHGDPLRTRAEKDLQSFREFQRP